MASRFRRDKIRNMANPPKIVKTDVQKIFQRPLDYKDFGIIFDFRNEYQNSYRDVLLNDSTNYNYLKQSCAYEEPPRNDTNFLLCDELISESPDNRNDTTADQNDNIYQDSDDSCKDKDYDPDYDDDAPSDSEHETFSTKTKFRKCLMKYTRETDCSLNITGGGLDTESETIEQTKNVTINKQCARKHTQLGNDRTKKDLPIQQENMQTNRENTEQLEREHEILKPNIGLTVTGQAENKKTDQPIQQENTPITMQNTEHPKREDEIVETEIGLNITVQTENAKTHPPKQQENTLTNRENTEIPRRDDEILDTGIGLSHAEYTENINTDPLIQQGSMLTDKENIGQPGRDDEILEAGKGLTKAGKPRKRRKFNEPLDQRQEKKRQKQEEKLAMKNPCSTLCKCTTKISESQRKLLHDEYVSLNWEAQGLLIKCLVDEKPVGRRLQTNKDDPRRKVTYSYFVKSKHIERTEVCKTFFLTTLGYKANNDCRVMGALNKSIDCQKTERGNYERKNKIDKDVIKNHIMSYNPCVSHYRREHAPNKLYLPSDISVSMMYKQFCSKMPNIIISAEYYRKVVKELNISFAHLGNEECEQCAVFQQHDQSHVDNQVDYCEICQKYLAHKVRYRETRSAYKNDVKLAADDKDTIYYSVDLQKVVMLPRMEQYKAAIFCPRIIAFNESFVPLGTTQEQVPFAAVWNETVSGRNQEDIISTYQAFLTHKRDAKQIVLWVDNCSAQNKNWSLLSFLVFIINSNLIAAKTVTLKFFEPGHTFMSADSFHHQVELSMKRKNKVYDFPDFVECIRLANSQKNFVKIMEMADFFNYQDYSSQHKLRKNEPRIYLKDIMVVVVERGLFVLKYKTSHTDDFESPLDFIQTKIIKMQQFPEARPKTGLRGITDERKAAILQKLVPLMPENRQQFWRNLPTSNSAADLSQFQ